MLKTLEKATPGRLRITLILSFLFFIIFRVSAQNDTIFYDDTWKKTVKDSAIYFRPPVKLEDGLFRIKDYYITGELQMSGLSSSQLRDDWEGLVTWYNLDGSIFQQGRYVNNRLDGEFITFLNGKKLKAQYSNGRFVSGEQHTKYYSGSYYYTFKKNDTIVGITYEDDLKGIRFENYSTQNEYDLLIKYYGQNGKFLGQRKKLGNGSYDGNSVDYYYSPMRVRSINYYKNGNLLASTTYYPNGNLKILFQDKPELTKTYYDLDGEQLGKMTFLADRYGLKAYDGKEIRFHYGRNEDPSLKRSMVTYDKGTKVQEVIFYPNQEIKTITKYKGTETLEQIGFDENGKQTSMMKYKDYKPYNGTELLADREATYKDGKLVTELVYYTNTKIPFSKKNLSKEIFYDVDGIVLGEINFDTNEDYPKPQNGVKYFQDYYGGISSYEEYKDGFVVKRTSFRDRLIGANQEKRRFKRIEIYSQGTYNRDKEITHYSNGQIQAETTFRNYNESYGIYFDIDGNKIGEYDFAKKDGIRYKFFADSDEIQEFEKLKEGKRITFKKYTYGPNNRYGNIDPILIEDVDINCCAAYYDRKGKEISKVKFKDGAPWEGILYDPIYLEKYQYQSGVREGIYQKLNYNQAIEIEGSYQNDLRNGIFRTYNTAKVLIAEENYISGKLEGKSSYFDENGKTIAIMEYKDGLPFNGSRSIKQAYAKTKIIETYDNGKLVKKVEFLGEGTKITEYSEANMSKSTVYWVETDIKKMEYTSNNGQIDGAIHYYDKKGVEIKSAIIKGGRLTSGTVYLKANGGDGNMKYQSLTIKDKNVELVIYGEDDLILFQAKEKLYFGTNTYYMQNLNVYLDFINENKLYY